MRPALLWLCLTFSLITHSQSKLITRIDSLNNCALNSYKKNQIVTAFNEFNIAKRLADSIDYKRGQALSNFNLGNIYSLMRETTNAERSYNFMLEAAKEKQDDYFTAKAYLSLAVIKKQDSADQEIVVNLFNQALFYLNRYRQVPENKIGSNNLIIKTYINFSNFYLENNDLENTHTNLIKVKDIIDNGDNHNIYQLAGFNYTYGVYFFKKRLYNSANIKFNKALSYFDVNECSMHTNCLFLSKVYEKLSLSHSSIGNEKIAYENLLKYYKHKESFINKDRVQQIGIEKSRFLVENYKNEAKLATSEKVYQQKIAQKIRSINYVIVSTLILLIIGLAVLFRFYTSKRKLSNVLKVQNKQLKLAKNEALKSSEMKSNFISNVSHELRTPLYGVVGLTSIMLESNNLDSRDVKYLKSLKYSGDYLLNLINDILQVGKIEANNIDLNISSVNLKALIQNVTDSFDYSLEESNNQIHIIIDSNIPEFIFCDKLRLTQVLFNLVGNSIKFTQNGNIYVRAILQKLDEVYATFRFEISDDGSGIPEDKQTSIFESFTQLNENANTKYQGAGLGLSIASKIVNLFGSKIELESQLGKGSTFAFKVRFKIDVQTIIQNKNKKSKNTPCTGESNHFKVLVAEDNKINQIVTGNLLKKQNIQFDMVENGQEALEAYEASSCYDLILMDLNMPVMDGYEATFRIKAINKNIPIIALTASNPEEFVSSKFDVKFDDIITKPFDIDLFFSKINKLVDISKSKDVDENISDLVS